MRGKKIAILENRLGAQLAGLIAKRGGLPVSAPALAEVPDFDAGYIAGLIRELEASPPTAAIFQTGVGTHALFRAADTLGLTGKLLGLLGNCIVVVRGPKPTAALRSREVRVDLSAQEPFTTAEVLAALAPVALAGRTVVVQRYGAPNEELDRALRERGARVIDIPLYRWAMPEDTAPLLALIDALARGEIDAVAFTSASQVRNLFALAERSGGATRLAADLNGALVASIGPVCTRALARYGVGAKLEASPPKLGPFVNALDAALTP